MKVCSTERNLVQSSSSDSIRPNPNGDWPRIDPTAYIDPKALVIGNVNIGANVYIGPNAVIRADEPDASGEVMPIEIASECNVQDGVIIHALGGTQVIIGRKTSLAHGCIIHGPCTLGQRCFIGFKAVIYNAKLQDGVFVGAAAVIQDIDLPENTLVPPAAAILSQKDAATLTTKTEKAHANFAKRIATTNTALAKGYNKTLEKTF